MRKKIAVIMGGYSAEAEVSIKSGSVVVQHLNKEKYDVFPIHIYKEKWFFVDEQNQEIPINKNDFSVEIKGKKITFDAVFNAIHGSPGEDGYLQAYFKLINLPLTGCSMYASALTFNKRDMLSVLKPYGILSAPSFYLNKGEDFSVSEIVKKVGLPCFVKANKSGSSFGVYKVYEKQKLSEAIEKAFEVDDEILIESFLEGTEVSVGVITYKGKIKVLPMTEIVSHNDFFDYEAKYLGQSDEITPARISAEMTEKINILAEKIYRILKMKGFSRSEFIIVGETPYLLEMNTTPGLSEASLLPQQAKVAGISLSDLFENAIEEAINEF
ncbi:D-alanine--D-alanine ligase [Capnocytophaga cynodegmi]|uniref:D-alanine--D-alanine ligase n=1 Tax=Capnocytophaga cynodegmi TaxID=28189 RepID=UPI001AD2B841|nr:D-alanine--D-alanine ligase [Capnocytophaga cynodegmi]GIM53830.1 D-alanine--D-alanine ligase [Capnocytophaga cynodegmi]